MSDVSADSCGIGRGKASPSCVEGITHANQMVVGFSFQALVMPNVELSKELLRAIAAIRDTPRDTRLASYPRGVEGFNVSYQLQYVALAHILPRWISLSPMQLNPP